MERSSACPACYERLELAPCPSKRVEIDGAVDAGAATAAVVLPDQPLLGAEPGRQHDAAGPERLAREVAAQVGGIEDNVRVEDRPAAVMLLEHAKVGRNLPDQVATAGPELQGPMCSRSTIGGSAPGSRGTAAMKLRACS